MEPKVFELDVVVENHHLDEMNHVNNVQYLQWVQDVAKAHWEAEAKSEWIEDYAWVALNHFIEYKKPAYLGDLLKLTTHVHEFSGVKSVRLVRIYNSENDQLLAQAKTEWCLVSKLNFKPMRIPNELLGKYFI